MITLRRMTTAARNGPRWATGACPTTPATGATRSSLTEPACLTPGRGARRRTVIKVRNVHSCVTWASWNARSSVIFDHYFLPGGEHQKATTAACTKQLHVCCRHPDFPDPASVDSKSGGRGERCEDRARADTVRCGGVSPHNSEEAIFIDEQCVFESCKKPATQKCGKRNTFGVEPPVSDGNEVPISSEYNVGRDIQMRRVCQTLLLRGQ